MALLFASISAHRQHAPFHPNQRARAARYLFCFFFFTFIQVYLFYFSIENDRVDDSNERLKNLRDNSPAPSREKARRYKAHQLSFIMALAQYLYYTYSQVCRQLRQYSNRNNMKGIYHWRAGRGSGITRRDKKRNIIYFFIIARHANHTSSRHRCPINNYARTPCTTISTFHRYGYLYILIKYQNEPFMNQRFVYIYEYLYLRGRGRQKMNCF